MCRRNACSVRDRRPCLTPRDTAKDALMMQGKHAETSIAVKIEPGGTT
jgi:hypothetical protein